MEINRMILAKMEQWKESETRRPLIIQGARQIGKTWAMKKFGESHYRHTAYFNFDSNEELAREFQKTKNPRRLIETLRLYTEVPIVPGETLLIFDEIQESPEALNSLKYFEEESGEYHIVAAGSLLGLAIHHHRGFPVGKVDFLKMYPVSFREFLDAVNPEVVRFIDGMVEADSLPEIISGKMWEAYRRYQLCGGMPRAVVASLENRGTGRIVAEQREILTSYFYDFSKHAPATDFPKIAAVWNSLPSQLARENRKFVYKVVKEGARAREYENAIEWLREAGLIYRIYCCSKPGLPLSAFDDLSAFKIYMLDGGLLRELSNLPAEILVSESPEFVEFKGALTENMVLQSLLPAIEQTPRYWVSDGRAEVDFIIQEGLRVVPLEVKSARNTSSRSLSVYIGKYDPKISVLLSGQELSVTDRSGGGKILRLPLPMVGWLPKFMAIASGR